MSDEITAPKGTPVGPEDVKVLDRARMGVGRPTPGRGEVAPQTRSMRLMACPWCGAMNWVFDDPGLYVHYTCWYCQMVFTPGG